MLRELMPVWDRSPARPWNRLEREMEKLFRGWGGTGSFEPAVNVAETEKEFEVTMELPGMKPEDVKVEMYEGGVMISGERKEEKEEKGKTWHRVERNYGSFRRFVPLPVAVEEGKIEAKFTDGMLRVALPKSKEVMPHRIEVKGT
jgi:HSP20 family protein